MSLRGNYYGGRQNPDSPLITDRVWEPGYVEEILAKDAILNAIYLLVNKKFVNGLLKSKSRLLDEGVITNQFGIVLVKAKNEEFFTNFSKFLKEFTENHIALRDEKASEQKIDEIAHLAKFYLLFKQEVIKNLVKRGVFTPKDLKEAFQIDLVQEDNQELFAVLNGFLVQLATKANTIVFGAALKQQAEESAQETDLDHFYLQIKFLTCVAPGVLQLKAKASVAATALSNQSNPALTAGHHSSLSNVPAAPAMNGRTNEHKRTATLSVPPAQAVSKTSSHSDADHSRNPSSASQFNSLSVSPNAHRRMESVFPDTPRSISRLANLASVAVSRANSREPSRASSPVSRSRFAIQPLSSNQTQTTALPIGNPEQKKDSPPVNNSSSANAVTKVVPVNSSSSTSAATELLSVMVVPDRKKLLSQSKVVFLPVLLNKALQFLRGQIILMLYCLI